MCELDRLLELVPHKYPYRFVDKFLEVSDNHVVGSYFLHHNSFFYEGHFPDATITPGFIITEIMAQIGLLGQFLYYLKPDMSESLNRIYLTSADVSFKGISYPGDNILVKSEKIYIKHNKLLCHIKSYNQNDQLLCKGNFAGFILT